MKNGTAAKVGVSVAIVATILIVIGAIIGVNQEAKRNELRRRLENWVETVAINKDNRYLWTTARKNCVVNAMLDEMSEDEVNYLTAYKLKVGNAVGGVKVKDLTQKLVNCYWAE